MVRNTSGGAETPLAFSQTLVQGAAGQLAFADAMRLSGPFPGIACVSPP